MKLKHSVNVYMDNYANMNRSWRLYAEDGTAFLIIASGTDPTHIVVKGTVWLTKKEVVAIILELVYSLFFSWKMKRAARALRKAKNRWKALSKSFKGKPPPSLFEEEIKNWKAKR